MATSAAIAQDAATTAPRMGEDFASLLEESLRDSEGFEGTVVKGRVVSIDNDMALIDVGLKSEGRVALKEFGVPGQAADIKIGDMVDVFIERLEDKNGEAMLSREKARREEAWTQLEKSFNDQIRVTGVIHPLARLMPTSTLACTAFGMPDSSCGLQLANASAQSIRPPRMLLDRASAAAVPLVMPHLLNPVATSTRVGRAHIGP